MKSRATLAWTVLLAAACGAQMASTIARSTPSPGRTVFDCFAEETKARGFDVSSIDQRDLRLVVVRVDKNVYISDATFRRAEDRLTLQVSGRDSEGRTALQVDAQTFYVFFTRRGLEYRERKASDAARHAAETITDRCAPTGESGKESP